MVAEWVETLVMTIYTALSSGIGETINANAGDNAAGLVSLVTAGFAIGAAALGFAPMKNTDAADRHRVFLEGMQNSLDSINQTLWHNQELLKENREIIERNQEIMKQIQRMISASAEENRQMIRGLHVTLQQFESNMMAKFDKIKAFMIEQSFTEDTLLSINTVWLSMNIAMESQKEEDLDRFKYDYLATRPESVLQSFASGLEYHTSNPVVSAMNANVLKSRFILENYMQVYSHLVVKVIAIEGFYYGLSHGLGNSTDILPNGQERSEFMNEFSETVTLALNCFRTHVLSFKFKEEQYWPGIVSNTILSAITSSESENTVKLADSIKQQLYGIYTTDVFTIYAYYCANKPELSGIDCTPWPLMKFNTVDIGTSSYHEKMTRFMVNAEKNSYHIVVLRSVASKDIDEMTIGMVRHNFHIHSQFEEQKPLQSMRENLGNDAFLQKLDAYFRPNSTLVNGFVAYGKITPEIRYVNNGTSVLSVGKGCLPHKFYGLNWV